MPKHPQKGHKGSHLTQGGWGTPSQKKSAHDPHAQGVTGARQGPSSSERGGAAIPQVSGTKSSGSKEQPPNSWVDGKRNPERQGGSIHGHDRIDPTLGKAKSGSHLDQHPSLKK